MKRLPNDSESGENPIMPNKINTADRYAPADFFVSLYNTIKGEL